MYSCKSDARAVQQEKESSNTQHTKRVLFNTDTNNEVNDQHALAYLLFNNVLFDIEGVTVNSTKKTAVSLLHLVMYLVVKSKRLYRRGDGIEVSSNSIYERIR